MSDRDARREMVTLKTSDRMDGTVLGNYTTTDDRREGRSQECIDYVVYWPKGSVQSTEISVLQREFKREKGKRPFDHPIVLYRFGDAFRDLAQQFGNITLDDEQRESESGR